jgi:hypothetical protein
MVLSGPASGVRGDPWFGNDTGSSNLVAIEVGGTSCDVTLMRDGAVQMTDQLDVDGYCIAIPSVEIHTIGAGGGTLGHLDSAGMLHAGPQGAGARPGPASYGLGGTRPTVTDAQLVLGRLAPGPYAGGAISLDLERAAHAIDTHLAAPMGLSVQQAAAGLIRLVEQNIQHAVERVSIERGYDPRDTRRRRWRGSARRRWVSRLRPCTCRGWRVCSVRSAWCTVIDRLRMVPAATAGRRAGLRGGQAQATTRWCARGRPMHDRAQPGPVPHRQQWPVVVSRSAAGRGARSRRIPAGAPAAVRAFQAGGDRS